MSTIACTGSDQPEHLEENYNGQEVSIKAVGGNVYYINVPDRDNLGNWAVRTAEVTDVTSGATGIVSAGVGTYAVADGSLYREGENVPVLSTADAIKGAIHITSIDSNVLTFTKNGAKSNWFTPVSGDKLVRRRDNFFVEDDGGRFESKRYKYLLLNGSTTTVLTVSIMGTGEKKKYWKKVVKFLPY